MSWCDAWRREAQDVVVIADATAHGDTGQTWQDTQEDTPEEDR
jgi:hypothetical protein